MLSNAVYSVLSPEGFASILWKEKGRVREACEVMKMTAYDMLDSGVVDEVIEEPGSGIKNDAAEINKLIVWSSMASLTAAHIWRRICFNTMA